MPARVCVGCKRIYVQQRIYDEFLRLFLERIAQLRTGISIESELGPIRIDSVRQRLHEHLSDAIARGATLLTPAAGGRQTHPHPSFSPTSLRAHRLCFEESFGPIVCVAPFATEA